MAEEFYKGKPFNAAKGKEADERNIEMEIAGNSANDPADVRHDGESETVSSSDVTGAELHEEQTLAERVCELLTQRDDLDSSGIEIAIEHGEVTLRGTVPSERESHLAADLLKTLYSYASVHNELKVDPAGHEGAMAAETRSTLRRPEAKSDPLKISEGMLVVGSEGEHVGQVKTVHDADFLVARRFAHDLYIPYSAFNGIDGDRVRLSIPASDVDKWGWDKPVVIPPPKTS